MLAAGSTVCPGSCVLGNRLWATNSHRAAAVETLDATVLGCVHNGAESLPTWLAHLEQQTYPAARFEILVVDVASTDETPGLLVRHAAGGPVRTRCIDEPGGSFTKARNAGIREAKGDYVLLLDLDLLAAPGLVEEHLRCHKETGGEGAVLGSISRHPQLGPGALTRWFLAEDRPAVRSKKPPGFLDWSAANLSLPRSVMAGSNDLDEGFAGSQFDLAELAQRLTKQGVATELANEASAYVWLPIALAEERRRQYARGHALHRLLDITRAREIRHRFSTNRSFLRDALERLVIPYYLQACEQGDEDTRVFGRVYRRILRFERERGFLDAHRGRPYQEAAASGAAPR